MKPAAVYLRVSKDDGSQTTDNQRPEVMQMADGRGYAVVEVYEDQASGAKGADERPALRRLLDDAARGKFRAVFVWRLDRLSRDDTFHGGALMIGQLDAYGVAILSHQQPWCDTSGPFRNVLVQFALSLAADERRTLIERTRRGIERARLHGTKTGKSIGRPRAQMSDALIARAAALRAGEPLRPGLATVPNRPWRDVRALLTAEGFVGVPSHPTLAAACQARGENPPLKLPPG
jgi:DNA invertase Pin-like site-specific DNA recombinase